MNSFGMKDEFDVAYTELLSEAATVQDALAFKPGDDEIDETPEEKALRLAIQRDDEKIKASMNARHASRKEELGFDIDETDYEATPDVGDDGYEIADTETSQIVDVGSDEGEVSAKKKTELRAPLSTIYKNIVGNEYIDQDTLLITTDKHGKPRHKSAQAVEWFVGGEEGYVDAVESITSGMQDWYKANQGVFEEMAQATNEEEFKAIAEEVLSRDVLDTGIPAIMVRGVTSMRSVEHLYIKRDRSMGTSSDSQKKTREVAKNETEANGGTTSTQNGNSTLNRDLKYFLASLISKVTKDRKPYSPGWCARYVYLGSLNWAQELHTMTRASQV